MDMTSSFDKLFFDPINIPSIKLIERLGFKKEAHFTESILSGRISR